MDYYLMINTWAVYHTNTDTAQSSKSWVPDEFYCGCRMPNGKHPPPGTHPQYCGKSVAFHICICLSCCLLILLLPNEFFTLHRCLGDLLHHFNYYRVRVYWYIHQMTLDLRRVVQVTVRFSNSSFTDQSVPVAPNWCWIYACSRQ